MITKTLEGSRPSKLHLVRIIILGLWEHLDPHSLHKHAKHKISIEPKTLLLKRHLQDLKFCVQHKILVKHHFEISHLSCIHSKLTIPIQDKSILFTKDIVILLLQCHETNTLSGCKNKTTQLLMCRPC